MAYRSQFEEDFAADLRRRGIDFTYEDHQIPYWIPHIYNLDFCVLTRGERILGIETKGYFSATDRRKVLAVVKEVKAGNAPIDELRLVFMRPKTLLRRGAKTTYGQWADRHGIVWAAKRMPDSWLNDDDNE